LFKVETASNASHYGPGVEFGLKFGESNGDGNFGFSGFAMGEYSPQSSQSILSAGFFMPRSPDS
jgi:hypothetical protein